MQSFHSILLICLVSLLLAGCGDFERRMNIALYGSEEEARIAKEEFKAGQNERDLKKQREMEKELFALITEERKKNNLKISKWDDKLQDYVRIRAKEVAERNSKYRPNGKMYYTLYDEFVGQKTYSGMKEVRSTLSQPQSVIKNWLLANDTRKILMAPYLFKYAVGVFKEGYTYYWVFVTIG